MSTTEQIIKGIREETCQVVDLKKYNWLRITDETEIPEQKVIIKINGETVSSAGDITTVSGEVKSGKSAFISAILAGAINRTGSYDGFSWLEVAPNYDSKAVIHFDTEQHRGKQQKTLKKIIRRAGFQTCPDYFLSYNIRELELNECNQTIEKICEAANNEHKGIHLIILDGGADCLSDINNSAESKEFVKYLMKLANTYACPVVVIVHLNPGSDKERGHFGSECQRKSESVIQVKNDNDVSFIEGKFLRNASKGKVSSFQFVYDIEKGYHVDFGAAGKTSKQSAKDEARINEVLETCQKVFATGGLKYEDAINKIMLKTKKKERSAKDYFKEMKVHQFIFKSDDEDVWRLHK